MLWIDFVKSLVGPALAFIGLFVGSKLARSHDNKKRQLDFIEKQLRELYGPLWGLRQEILALSNFRLEVEIAHTAWASDQMDGYEHLSVDDREELTNQIREATLADVEYNNTLLTSRLLPHYQEMMDTFREKMWLADADLLDHWANFVKFVDTWDRSMNSKIHPDIFRVYRVRERRLHPFYDLLEKHVSDSRLKLESGNPELKSKADQKVLPSSVADEMDKAVMLEFIEGYRWFLGNISPERLKAFAWAMRDRPTGDEDAKFTVEDEDGVYREVRIKALRKKKPIADSQSCVRIMLE